MTDAYQAGLCAGMEKAAIFLPGTVAGKRAAEFGRRNAGLRLFKGPSAKQIAGEEFKRWMAKRPKKGSGVLKTLKWAVVG